MIRAVIFDLDGVLVDTKDIHYDTFNRALGEIAPYYRVSRDEHLRFYDGLPTKEKLAKLTADKQLPEELHERIWKMKQELTEYRIREIKPNGKLKALLAELRANKLLVLCASNAVPKTVSRVLQNLDIADLFNNVYHNQSVRYAKPNPAVYLQCMADHGLLPSECLIVEDSPHGRQAAKASGAFVLPVEHPEDVTIENVRKAIDKAENMNVKKKWSGGPLNILIPMAGAGKRFQEAGYTFPKPLIDVRGKPMIQVVVENLGLEGKYIFVVQKEHYEQYALGHLLQLIAPGCEIVQVSGLTQGAACTTLLAKQFINDKTPLVIAMADQFAEWDSSCFMYELTEEKADGGILTFENCHPKWSYAKVGPDGWVSEVAEKQPISKDATVGYYYWSRGKNYVDYATKMIEREDTVNGEYYVCPVFNHAINDGARVKAIRAAGMYGLGTPEDLQAFLQNYKGPV